MNPGPGNGIPPSLFDILSTGDGGYSAFWGNIGRIRIYFLVDTDRAEGERGGGIEGQERIFFVF